VVASALAGQLGSSPEFLSNEEHDMRILSVLKEEELPLFVYAKIRTPKSRSWGVLYDELLHLKRSVGGRGLRDIIKMEQVSHGVAADVASELEAVKPGWVARNTLQRDWKEKAISEGKV